MSAEYSFFSRTNVRKFYLPQTDTCVRETKTEGTTYQDLSLQQDPDHSLDGSHKINKWDKQYRHLKVQFTFQKKKLQY